MTSSFDSSDKKIVLVAQQFQEIFGKNNVQLIPAKSSSDEPAIYIIFSKNLSINYPNIAPKTLVDSVNELLAPRESIIVDQRHWIKDAKSIQIGQVLDATKFRFNPQYYIKITPDLLTDAFLDHIKSLKHEDINQYLQRTSDTLADENSKTAHVSAREEWRSLVDSTYRKMLEKGLIQRPKHHAMSVIHQIATQKLGKLIEEKHLPVPLLKFGFYTMDEEKKEGVIYIYSQAKEHDQQKIIKEVDKIAGFPICNQVNESNMHAIEFYGENFQLPIAFIKCADLSKCTELVKTENPRLKGLIK